MKKIIILIAAFSLCLAVNAQEKFNADGSSKNLQKQDVITIVNDNQNVDNKYFDADGQLKKNTAFPYQAAENTPENLNGVNADGSVGKIIAPVSKQPPVVKTEVYVRKTNSDIPVDYSNGVKENYTRKSSVDIPVDYSNGVKENYQRTSNVKEENQSTYAGTISNNQQVAEADKNLSDAELNKKYPNRNTNVQTIAPATGTKSSVSDAELQKQIPAKGNSFLPAKTQNPNQISDKDLNKLRTK